MATSQDIIVNFARRPAYTKDIQRDIFSNFENIKDIVAPLDAGQSITGTFTTTDGKTITVTDGIITGIV